MPPIAPLERATDAGCDGAGPKIPSTGVSGLDSKSRSTSRPSATMASTILTR